MSSPTVEDPLEIGYDLLARGDAEAAGGSPSEARRTFELALDKLRGVDGDDLRRDNGSLGQCEARRRLGDLAERSGALGEATEHYEEMVRTLGELLPRHPDAVRSRYIYGLLQLARLAALTDQPRADDRFRIALRLADTPSEQESRAVIWHYVGAYCQRRALPIAAFLAHQRSIEELPADAPTERWLVEVRQQLRALQELGEVMGALALVRLLERHGALSDDNTRIASSSEIVAQLGLAPPAATELLRVLDRPATLVELRDDVLTRMRSAVPDFSRRFVSGDMSLEDTRHAVLEATRAQRR